MGMSRTLTATVVVAAVLTATALGTAQAATAGSAAPSACRPANHLAKIAQDRSSAGHLHFRVTLTAPRGYAPCTLAGSPADLSFSGHGRTLPVTAGWYGDQNATVTFGPGRPVHFDIQVPDTGRTTPADEASFTLRAPDGMIPGTSVAEGAFAVTKGTLIGPVQPGA
ncbi:DUF4232 domain-containing protein [Streptomyces sp. NPDC051567]|uniref:DUF4232 domain-containing protein n=1 Tax=Streptomyces sp. NPDC051567 TaxID=3365660 RepID=UPI0037A7B1F6